jgi:hypothetical protein
VIVEAKATTFEWKVSKEEDTLGEWGIGIGNVLENEVAGGLKGLCGGKDQESRTGLEERLE